AWIGSIDIAQAKAFTATAFCNDNATPVCVNTLQLQPLVQPGGPLFGLQSTNRKDGIVAFPGGVTLCQSGVPIGAIGVSGGSIAQDQDVARTAAVNAGFLCAGQ
ncbi:MAG: GlcG/HbpS family heme-binding protein, partial [Candidatus Methylomirabilis sp.]